MFDFTPLAKTVALSFLVYFLLFPVGAVLLLVSHYTVGWDDAAASMLGFVNWPLPVLFPLLSVVLLVDFFRRLESARLSTTQVTGYRVAAGFMVFGAAFGLSSGHWLPTAVSAGALLVLLVPTRGRATPSTWELK